MTWNDFVRKITSRKLWVAVAEFVSMLVIAFGGTEDTATTVTALIMAGAGAIAYVVAEGLTDSAGAKSEAVVIQDVTDEETQE